MRTGRSDRFAQAWFVPRWTTTSPGATSVYRTSTPLVGGGVRTGRSVGSAGSPASIGAGVRSVIQTSWNAAVPTSSVLGVGASERTTDLPEASWPVTIRRGGALMGREFIIARRGAPARTRASGVELAEAPALELVGLVLARAADALHEPRIERSLGVRGDS